MSSNLRPGCCLLSVCGCVWEFFLNGIVPSSLSLHPVITYPSLPKHIVGHHGMTSTLYPPLYTLHFPHSYRSRSTSGHGFVCIGSWSIVAALPFLNFLGRQNEPRRLESLESMGHDMVLPFESKSRRLKLLNTLVTLAISAEPYACYRFFVYLADLDRTPSEGKLSASGSAISAARQ